MIEQTVTFRDRLQSALGAAYTIERELDGDGRSRVFLAEQSDGQVMLKVLPAPLSVNLDIESFRRETQALPRLHHPLIVPVLAADVTSGWAYYTMPFIEGESLRALLARTDALSADEAVRIMRDILTALCYAHEQGVIHQGIEPNNIVLLGDHALLTEFGISRALRVSNRYSFMDDDVVVLGHPLYMSPEQMAGAPDVDQRTDLYAVGMIGYEMLAGRPAFSGDGFDIITAKLAGRPASISSLRPWLAEGLSTLIMRALENRRENRYPSSREMLEALDAAVVNGAVDSHARRVGG